VIGGLDTSDSLLSGKGQFTSGTNDTVFDFADNGFTVQAMDLTIVKQPSEPFGGLVDLTLGKGAITIASYGTQLAPPSANNNTQRYDIRQAYIQYATGSLTVIGGKFATLAGEEVVKTTGDTNFSRFILFGYAVSFTHSGRRATYQVSDAVRLTGGINNGWDQATDINSNKTIEVGVASNPSRSFALTVQDYYGIEQIGGLPGGPQGNRNLLDLIGTSTVSDSLSLVLNYDNGPQEHARLANTETAHWNGAAGYANYQIDELLRLSARAEVFSDDDGYCTGVSQKWKEATLTVGYAPKKMWNSAAKFARTLPTRLHSLITTASPGSPKVSWEWKPFTSFKYS
jgi:hypothetical protein